MLVIMRGMKMDSKKERLQNLKKHLYGYREWLICVSDRYSEELNTPEIAQIEIELCDIINSLNNCIVHLTKGGI